jgi:hypothetical protein
VASLSVSAGEASTTATVTLVGYDGTKTFGPTLRRTVSVGGNRELTLIRAEDHCGYQDPETFDRTRAAQIVPRFGATRRPVDFREGWRAKLFGLDVPQQIAGRAGEPIAITIVHQQLEG